MKIFSHAINFPKTNYLNFNSNSNIYSAEIKPDTFEYKTQIKPWDERRTKALFDKTYNAVISQNIMVNPIVEKLSLTKPKIILTNSSNSTAKYRFSDNTVELDLSHVKEDYFLCENKNANGTKNPVGVLTKSQLDENLDEIRKTYPNLSTTKLTDKEKETYISTFMAHELRHFIQAHLMASCKDTHLILKEKHEALKNKIAQLIAEIEAEGESVDIDPQEKFSYSLSYKPKKLLDENSTFKFSMFKDDDRLWSIKDNFLASELRILDPSDSGNNKDNNYETYLSSAQEVDAYNYQYEYLLTQMSRYNDNFRENVMFGLCAILEADADLALETMHKTGGKFINE